MRMFRGDKKPDLVITCSDNGAVVNLTAATSIRLIGVSNGVVVIDAAVSGTATGVVTYVWQTVDTATVRTIKVEVEVTWPGAKKQTFRPGDAVQIVPDYG